MPTKPLKECNKLGCYELTRDTYCDKHMHIIEDRKRESSQYYDKYIRDEKSTKFYNSSNWKKLRELVMSKWFGRCADCYEYDNKLVQANVVDHVVPIKIDWSMRYDALNCRPLCHMHHNKKTREDERKYR